MWSSLVISVSCKSFDLIFIYCCLKFHNIWASHFFIHLRTGCWACTHRYVHTCARYTGVCYTQGLHCLCHSQKKNVSLSFLLNNFRQLDLSSEVFGGPCGSALWITIYGDEGLLMYSLPSTGIRLGIEKGFIYPVQLGTRNFYLVTC